MKTATSLYPLLSVKQYLRGFFLVCLCMLFSCSTKEEPQVYVLKEDSPLSRPNPGYVQYVANRSLLSSSTTTLATIAGTTHSLNNQKNASNNLTQMGSVWLYINPATYSTDITSSFMKSLEYANSLDMIKELGVQGIYTSPLFGTSFLWTNNNKMTLHNEDAVQLELSSDVGTMQEFMELRTKIGNEEMLFGTAILPVATGMGADFWLASRGVEDYMGVYTMLLVPKELWAILPQVEQGTYASPLSQPQVQALQNNAILPNSFLQDSLHHFATTGWAVTPEIMDIYGEGQRYVYRYYKEVELPLLHWNNPTLQAVKILNASIIQNIGVYGSALLGVSALPYYGFTTQSPYSQAYISASQHMQKTVQHYGAFAFVEDALPLYLLAEILNTNDSVFVYDSITAPYAEYALLTQDTSLLQEMLSQALSLSIPFERLIHTTPNEKGISTHPLSLYTEEQKEYISTKAQKTHSTFLQKIKTLQKNTSLQISNGTIPYTGALLSATSLGISFNNPTQAERLQFDEKKYTSIVHAHRALIFFKAMLPGILMLSGQDFSAPLPLTKDAYEQSGAVWKDSLAGYGAYSFQVMQYSTNINRFGMPKVKTLYPEFQTQDIAPFSFKKEVETILALRSQLDIAHSRILGIIPTDSKSIAVVLQKNNGEIIIAITNFSAQKSTVSLSQHSIPELNQKINKAKIVRIPQKIISNTTITLKPFEYVILRIQ